MAEVVDLPEDTDMYERGELASLLRSDHLSEVPDREAELDVDSAVDGCPIATGRFKEAGPGEGHGTIEDALIPRRAVRSGRANVPNSPIWLHDYRHRDDCELPAQVGVGRSEVSTIDQLCRLLDRGFAEHGGTGRCSLRPWVGCCATRRGRER